MKFDELRSIGHNIADSLGSGIGFLIGGGFYDMDVFGEAGRSAEGFMAIDFLTGETAGAKPSRYLARAIARYRTALGDAMPQARHVGGGLPRADGALFDRPRWPAASS